MEGTFSNPILMAKVKADLLEAAAKPEPYCDPMFGTLFTDIVGLTNHIVTWFSCQGHFVKTVFDNEGHQTYAYTDTCEDSEAISNPYIVFLCTYKGKLLIDLIFETLINKARQKNYPLYMFVLETDCYGGPDVTKEEETFRVTLKVEGGWALHDKELHSDVIGIIKDSIYEVIDELRYPKR